MVASAFMIDTRDLVTYARSLGNGAPKIIGNALTDEMREALVDVQTAVTRRVKLRSGTYGRSFKRNISVQGTATIGTLTNNATSRDGFVYAFTLENGRGRVTVKNARALRFEIGGQVFFRHSVGPAAAQHPMEYGLRDALPQINARFEAAGSKAVAQLEALR